MRRLVLGIAVAVTSLLPVMGMADDQQIADYIKGRLQAEQQQGNLRGFNVDMRVDKGTVFFKGHVSNSTQEMTILRSAQQAGHLGVVQVVDDITVRGGEANTFQNAGYQQQQPQPQSQLPQYTQPQPQYTPAQYTPAQTQYSQPQFQQASSQEYIGPAIDGIISGEPLAFASSGGASALPGSYSSAPQGYSSESPNLPGYAWPGYAASPNYGALSYPKQYSASAWPYIGPFYPYPQVPLGWRKVSLEWDDGWWMLDFHDK